MDAPRSTTRTLIDVMRILAADIKSDDGVANAAIAEAADRLEEYMVASLCQTFSALNDVETDPTGRQPSDPGAKLDAGKPRLGLVFMGFARALQEVGKVGTFGAHEYSDDGWIDVPDGRRRYTDAMFRHFIREAIGEECDRKSGLKHAAHAAWNALAWLDLDLRITEGKSG